MQARTRQTARRGRPLMCRHRSRSPVQTTVNEVETSASAESLRRGSSRSSSGSRNSDSNAWTTRGTNTTEAGLTIKLRVDQVEMFNRLLQLRVTTLERPYNGKYRSYAPIKLRSTIYSGGYRLSSYSHCHKFANIYQWRGPLF